MKVNAHKRPCVLVFAGLDPSGGAGISADIEAIGDVGAHALPIITALTVQDNDRVFSVNPVSDALILEQAHTLAKKIEIAAIKIGIVGNSENAKAIAQFIDEIREHQPNLPVVLDTVLGSGHGCSLTEGIPEFVISPLISKATLITPNLPEAARLFPKSEDTTEQANFLLTAGAQNVLIKGGHGTDKVHILNEWFSKNGKKQWQWHRLPGEFHGTGCTLASAIAAYLAQGFSMERAIHDAQQWCQETLHTAYTIAEGQAIPSRHIRIDKKANN